MDNSPLKKALDDYNLSASSRFHTPSHKANADFLGFGKTFLEYDVTELPTTGSLFDGVGATAQAEDIATKYFNTQATRFSAGGCTLCIQAMFKLIAKNGNKVVCCRQVHKSAVNAMALLDLEPIWIFNEVDENALPKAITAKDVEKVLECEKDVAGVYITSPDYYGTLTDISEVSKVTKRYNVPLIVDNAHGTHLWFSKEKLHPILCGATMSADSAHKTLPVLTGGAYLQINSKEYAKKARQAMALFGSTSPSYPVMMSLDLARCWLEKNGEKEYAILEEKVFQINQFAKTLGFGLKKEKGDPMRITLNTAVLGYTGDEAAEILRENHVEIEYSDSNWIVLIPSPFNSERDFQNLKIALTKIKPKKSISYPCKVIIEKPQKKMSVRKALFSDRKTVDVKDSLGMVVAQTLCPCPPGIPVIMPGEVMNENAIKILLNSSISEVEVVLNP